MPKKVIVSGIGIISPIGTGKDRFWEAAAKGTNGVFAIKSFDTSDYRSKTGGEVKDFDAKTYLCDNEINVMGRAGQFAVAAAKMALDDAKLKIGDINPHRIGVSMGTTMGEPQVIQNILENFSKDERIFKDIKKGECVRYPSNTIPANVARFIGVKGATTLMPTACAAGNYAIGYALDLIRMGRLDYVIAGGSDPFATIAFCGFNRLLATTMDVCRPFDLNRGGMAVAEGAGILIMETLVSAQARGAEIYGEVLGYGLGCDAHDMTAPHPEGLGGILAMERAIAHSKISKKEIDYICAHGTGTPANDKAETKIAKAVFGDDAYKIPMSSLKSMLGHTMGAASAIEAAASLLMIKNKKILPTINYETPDPDCDLDYVPNTARDADLNIIISNAYAFGGNTSAIVLKKYEKGE